MSDFNSKDILIFQSENLYVEKIDNRLEGEFNKVHWHDLTKIKDAILTLISHAGGKVESASCIDHDEKNRAHVGYRISILHCDAEIDFHSVVTNFLSEISKNDNLSGDLLNQIKTDYDHIIKKEAHDFLLQNGSKPIRQAIEIKMGDSFTSISGRFGKVPSRAQDLDDPPEVHFGIVDGLLRYQKTVHLKLDPQKIIVAFCHPNDFNKLIELMLSKEIYEFTIQNKLDAGGKKNLNLIAFNQPPESFFNVLT